MVAPQSLFWTYPPLRLMRLRFSQWSIKSLILQEISQHCVMMFLNSFSSCLISRACLIVGPNLEPESKHKCDQFSTMLSNPYITNKLFQTPVIRYKRYVYKITSQPIHTVWIQIMPSFSVQGLCFWFCSLPWSQKNCRASTSSSPHMRGGMVVGARVEPEARTTQQSSNSRTLKLDILSYFGDTVQLNFWKEKICSAVE